jgi:hypothetical protein
VHPAVNRNDPLHHFSIESGLRCLFVAPRSSFVF